MSLFKKITSNSNNDFDKQNLFILRDDSPFSLTEAFNALRTKVIFSLPDVKNAVIGITGPEQNVGKTTTAINLAIAFSKLGKKVLLIDCDLRHPAVASNLRIKTVPGLSDGLVGLATMNECLRKTEFDGLDVLPAGNIPPNPTKLLQSKQMNEILHSAREHYDFTIVDFPPINTVTDAGLLSQSLDGYLLVSRHNVTEYKSIEYMLRELSLVNANVLGFVYNDVPLEKKGSYYYKYG